MDGCTIPGGGVAGSAFAVCVSIGLVRTLSPMMVAVSTVFTLRGIRNDS